MAEWQSGKITANGIRIHYLRTGGAKPPLVLSHGITDNGRCWTRVAEVLETTYDVIMPDARGHGLSDAPLGGYSADVMAADLASLMVELGLEPAVLMGHSMGARTSAVVAADYPHLVRAAILEDPPWWDKPSTGDMTSESTVSKARARMAMTFDELLVDQRKRHPTWVDAELLPWAEAKAQLSPNMLHDSTRHNRDWRQDVSRFSNPVLLLLGDPHLEAIVTVGVAEEAMKLNAHLMVARIQGAGHSIHRDQFEASMSAVNDFLATL